MSFKQLLFSVLWVILLVPLILMAQSTPTPTPYLTPTPPFTAPVPVETTSIEIGQTIKGRFTDANAMLAYQFEGRAGQIISIVLQNTVNNGSTACITLNDSGFTPLAYNNTEYTSQGPRAVVSFFTLPGDHLYTINVSACGTTDEFELSLIAPTVETINFNGVIQGQVSDTERARAYRIEGLAGDLITIGFESFAFSPIVDFACADVVRCGAYSISIMNGYNPTTTTTPLTLPADAPYLVIVRTQDTSGEFRLAVNRMISSPIRYGDAVQAVFDGGVAAVHYKFSAAVGDIFNIRAESDGSLDTRLTLVSPDGSLVTQDDDSANGLDPEILNQLVYVPGDYTIILEPSSLGDVGTLTLKLSQVAPALLDQGPQQVKLTGKQASGVASFAGVAGEKVRVTAHIVSGLNASPQLDIRQNTDLLVNSYATGSDTFSVELTVPNTGNVVIFVSGGRGIIELSLERLGQAE